MLGYLVFITIVLTSTICLCCSLLLCIKLYKKLFVPDPNDATLVVRNIAQKDKVGERLE